MYTIHLNLFTFMIYKSSSIAEIKSYSQKMRLNCALKSSTTMICRFGNVFVSKDCNINGKSQGGLSQGRDCI